MITNLLNPGRAFECGILVRSSTRLPTVVICVVSVVFAIYQFIYGRSVCLYDITSQLAYSFMADSFSSNSNNKVLTESSHAKSHEVIAHSVLTLRGGGAFGLSTPVFLIFRADDKFTENNRVHQL